jgi:hypothetical protein
VEQKKRSEDDLHLQMQYQGRYHHGECHHSSTLPSFPTALPHSIVFVQQLNKSAVG